MAEGAGWVNPVLPLWRKDSLVRQTTIRKGDRQLGKCDDGSDSDAGGHRGPVGMRDGRGGGAVSGSLHRYSAADGDRVSVDLICSQNSPLILAVGGMSYDCDYYAGSPMLELGYGEEDGSVRRVDIEGGRTGIRRLDAPTDEAVFRVPVGVCFVT